MTTQERDLWKAGVSEPVNEAPPGFPGTIPEYAVYAALWRMQKSGEITGFEFQSPEMGGRYERGGSVLDFYLPDYRLGINVQSPFWHYGRAGKMASDALKAASLQSMGIKVIFIDEDDARENATYYVREAIKGIDHSRMVKG